MLALQMKLTPAQVKVLLLLAYAHRESGEMKTYQGKMVTYVHHPLEVDAMPSFLLTASALERRGLVTWNNTDKHYGGCVLTEEGWAITKLIYKQAKAITDLVEGSKIAATVEKEMKHG